MCSNGGLLNFTQLLTGPVTLLPGWATVGAARCTLEPMGYIVVGFYRALPYGEAVTAIAASVKEGSVVRS